MNITSLSQMSERFSLTVILVMVSVGMPAVNAVDEKKVSPKAQASQKAAPPASSGGGLGINIIGSQELPKVLYIVPWKSPAPEGEMPLVSRVLDEVFEPLDPDVFERQVDFHYQLINQTEEGQSMTGKE